MSASPELDFIAWMKQTMHAIAQEEARGVFKSLRPGGAAPLVVTINGNGSALVADSSHHLACIDVPYPGFLQGVNFRGDEVGSATVDLWVRRPTQVYAAAASVVGAHHPSISSATDAEVKPSDDWTTWLEADSTVYFFLTAVSGFTRLSINLILRATNE